MRKLPKELKYLQEYMNFLADLEPDELHEDTDVTLLDDAVRDRVKMHGADWEAGLDKDCLALSAWIQEDPENRSDGFFVLPFLASFDPDEPSVAEVLEQAKNSTSGFAVLSVTESETVIDQYGRLDFEVSGKVVGTFLKYDGWSDLASELKMKSEGLPPEYNVEITDVNLGPWKGKKLVLNQADPFEHKQVDYFLDDGNVEALVSVFREELGMFNESPAESLISRVSFVGGNRESSGR